MKYVPACAAVVAAVSIAACSPEAPAPAAPAPVAEAPVAPPAPAPAAVAYAGKWEGTITCYKIDSPLQVSIDAATPAKASVGTGPNGAMAWDATVAYDEATKTVTLTGPTPTADAAVIKGALSADGASISGAMDKQLCTNFSLKKAP